jgi:hypothetical protein
MTRQDLVMRYIAYAVMLAAVVAGLVGLLERDATARASARSGDVDVEYPRITRQGLKPSMVVEVRNAAPVARVPTLVVSGEYLEALQVGAVTPEPAEAAAVGDGLVEYRFAALGPAATLRASLAMSIDQQAPGVRFTSPLTVALGGRVLLDTRITTVVLP